MDSCQATSKKKAAAVSYRELFPVIFYEAKK